jgi:hypothetical protein
MRGGERQPRELAGMIHWPWRAALIGVTAAFLLGIAPLPPAAAAGVSVTLTPGALELPGREAATAALVVHDGTKHPIRVSIHVLANDVVSTDDPLPGQIVAAKGSRVWGLRLTRKPGAILPATVLIRTSYRNARKPGAVVKTVVTGLRLTAAPGQTVNDLAKVSVDTDKSRVDDVHETQLALLVANLSPDPINLRSVDLRYPDDVSVTAVDGAPKDVVIDAQTTEIVRYALKGHGQIERGGQTVVFTANLGWGRDFGTHGALVVSHSVDLGVFGESDLGTILQVPTLLLLPGLLAVLGIGILWQLKVRPSGTASGAPFPFGTLGPILWMVALLLSALGVVAFWQLGPYWGIGGISLIKGYGSKDVLILSAAMILVAWVFWIAYCGATLLRARRRTPREGMRPRQVLKILKRRRGNVWTEVADQPTGSPQNGPRRVLVLGKNLRGDTLICPPIAVRFKEPTEAAQQLERDLCAELTSKGKAKRVFRLLRSGHRRNLLSFEWRASGGMTGVEQTRDDLSMRPGTLPVVRLD